MALADPIPSDWIEPEPGFDEETDDEDDPLTYAGSTGKERQERVSTTSLGPITFVCINDDPVEAFYLSHEIATISGATSEAPGVFHWVTRDAAWHRQRHQQRRDQVTDDAPDDATGDSPNAPALSLATNSRDHEEASGSAEPLRNQLDDLLYSSDGEQGDADGQEGVTDDTSTPVRREDVLDLLVIADFEWNEIDLGAPPPERQEDQAQGDSQEQDGQDRVEDAAENVQWRDGVTDCNICLFPLDSKIWVCERETCRQPYHRHVDAPPTCTVCKRIVTGTMLEGPQCSQIFDYDCLVQYNAQFLEDVQAGYRGNDDNAFDYTEDQESADEYHQSDFDSSSDSDGDYNPGDEA
ncbi:hypothetical protein PHYSODRAFT_326591 [Phytophthora sojae]|uniref:Uncharacterized protein n=1 Tax=Phytophthora sojae (strain P6497) TaxID=1094619 RepID=G4YWF4_PHYSP|nr:hypothetical protein PHYSODRAFT_326591 [Phytophthora sojae]EGZ25600.1 hypothetical protein PHYSODRAFT_326591 [Phytophthora sojae]|eukprot:XP_009520888.1 hypothetical protein PHYSODRAFT_326591 [Phytophthora sojae]